MTVDGARSAARLEAGAGVAGVLVAGCAVLALAGWWLDAPVLMAWTPGGVAMNPLTALAFVASGAALVAVRREASGARARRVAAVLALLVIAAGASRLLSYALGLGGGAGPDSWLAGGRADASGALSRMAPNTALAFVLTGAALLALDTRRHRLGTAAALAGLVIAVTALIGYGFGGALLTGVRGFIPMALNTAAAFLALALGILAARPRRAPLAHLLGDGPGSRLARRLIPWVVVSALAVGWLLRHALGAGRLDVVHGMAALTAVLVIALGGVIVWAAGSLNRTDEERRQFFELSQDLLAVADFEGHFVELNPQWETQLGWPREELLRRPFIELVHPDDVAATLGEYARANAGQAVLRFTNRYRTRAGDYRWLEWCATTVPRLRRGFAVARDVTELRRLERDLAQRVEDLRNANQELEAFSYSVSHDLRAPLRHIAGFANLLTAQGGAGLTADAQRWLEIIQSSTRRMGALIDDLLAFSRIGRASVAPQPVDLGALMRETWDEVRQTAGDPPVHWGLGPLPMVLGDAPLLKVAFANLLDNALKYSGTRLDPAISVEATIEGGQVVVAVRDNGVGFDMRYADKLFGVFQRLHSREEFDGTGIGLATVRRVVQMHGGRVWAESELGQGATFRVALPLASMQHAAA